MSKNLATIKNVYQAFTTGDIPTVLSVLADDIEWTEALGGPYGGVFVGPQAILENVFMKLGGDWECFTAEPHQFIEDGDTIVVLGSYNGTHKTTGKSFEAPVAHVWQMADGMAVKFHQYTDTAVQLAATQDG
ncbi:nuclear transport factor 2 family protein [Marinicella rhabdoformis]|uniref:nuclear transport factor 2 family protein n=1 Tax=Marinicella rhabdoformis TaxID=2580566 RepID=UPI0012AEC73C|nr:nuclear transport factor 2 family protein [Marinicella rhabdoformis]